MNWYHALSIKNKVRVGIFASLAASSIFFLILSLIAGSPLWPIAVVVIIGAAVSLPLSSVVEKSLTSSMEDMTLVAYRIAKGDFTQRVDASNSSLGQLAHSFNSMIDKLREILGDTSRISRLVNETSTGIYEKNNGVKSVMEQVATSAGELATGANEISEEVGDMSESIRQIEAKVASYAESSRLMNERSEVALQLVQRGQQSVETQADGTRRTAEAAAHVSSAIERLSEAASGISAITRTISDLAEQTNLLSLNASIEAARAGEHGKGFAVVAQEVRKLAEESTASTKEVFGLVKGIEQGVKDATANMIINEKAVELQAEMLRETEAVFSEIVTSMQFISEQIQLFASESESMLDNARTISSAIGNISAITQQSAAGTEQVASSMNGQIVSIQSIVEETARMQQMASQLQRTIQIFKF
ncbi:methyl-accepting chemotaxis protein [Paenibacillus pasadenensis]|uniref:methyl-accepting chemotaxis protein n=1 Tax=Paenibacillus pasadenensis TaxID=217090 RepID=UPI002041469F|nr:HAMP domain-containing methyl-accepting chemotaxis protein [Paenibacillus pasadenensis]MCM3748250.1 methyl-accepting chemotaxis protein [Paenibacillus pasadenensis]